MQAPDFRHVESWIFDLDNTLYPAASDLFAQIDARMAAYVARELKLDPVDAGRLQKAYYRDHGTTLNGLMKLHDVDPEPYLAEVHDIDLSVLTPDPGLNDAITALPGRKFVFTNGCRNYAGRVLERLGLSDIADEVFDIRTTDFCPKPDPAAYDAVVAKAAIAPRRAAMFEDLARNLVPAHALGMTTVWIDNGSAWSRQGPEHPVAEKRHIDYTTSDLARFLKDIRT
ncbi:MAG: pyrimidine 5'-nucleotidase [Alphaproteobacteria bacterium]|nr:pyrimidine 5'-nucleotidase [Alphaproteobacteria bacterium]